MTLSTTEELIDDLRRGRMVVVMDDEDRENEGDIIMAAQHVRAEDINFMARYGRGLICLTLSQERCRQLRLPLMVDVNESSHSTNFTVSIEAAEGVTTGISAADRARTIHAAVRPGALPSDVVQPGHIFPLMSQPGGVLTRAGHTEAGCDLARLAGLEPASVIVEILNEDGTMARRGDLEKFASEHDLKLGTIADLIRYRVSNESTVERTASTEVDTEFGAFELISYEDVIDRTAHLALVRGDIQANEPTLVRVHVGNTLSDTLSVQHSEFGWPLRDALERMRDEETCVLVVLRHSESPTELARRILQLHSVAGDAEHDSHMDLRTYGIGAQILKDIGVRKMRVLSQPKRLHGLSGFDLEVVEYIST